MDDEPRWLTFEEVVETNVEQIERFGGLHGIKDENIIRSAIDNPKNSFHYGGEDDLLVLAVHSAWLSFSIMVSTTVINELVPFH
ncbi:MAG TPA: hypothetical protein VJR87_11490 [Allosphingosinicella sp.]|nr:hypothetical protein [Allosphingosinicella sp.]